MISVYKEIRESFKRVLVTGGPSELKRKKGGFGGHTRSAEG